MSGGAGRENFLTAPNFENRAFKSV
jgi:hypothetical protein